MKQANLNYSENLLLQIEKGNYKTPKNLSRSEKIKRHSTLKRLEKYKIITLIKKENSWAAKLTTNGLIKTQRIKWRLLNLKSRTKKDKICIIVFDIPENIRKTRDLFRKCLYELGYEKIQKSVFLGPQKSLPYVKQLTKNCKIQKYVIILFGKKSK